MSVKQKIKIAYNKTKKKIEDNPNINATTVTLAFSTAVAFATAFNNKIVIEQVRAQRNEARRALREERRRHNHAECTAKWLYNSVGEGEEVTIGVKDETYYIANPASPINTDEV